ncbi:MAG: HTH domain-containing protein [Spirochaetaceae bacterium]|jgi:transcriptional antiterminator|nr:HTH domain-containing protein [Spirochaetaceae bacterium]
MKDRQKRILRFMLLNKGILQIDDLAEAFSIGRRTVSRDLDVLDKWLSLRGSRLERKQNHGIQVMIFGNDPQELLEVINKPDSFLETLSPSVRQKLIFPTYILLKRIVTHHWRLTSLSC